MTEWDEDKSEATFAARGFDFAFAARVFAGDTLQRVDDRNDYGEARLIAVGEVDGVILTVVYSWRGDRRRIISARRASRHERRAYRHAFGGEAE